MKPGKFFSFPLGIDLIEIKKAKIFYQIHKDHLNSFFSDKEVHYIQKSNKRAEALGVLLAAKEAVFKALPRNGSGMIAFRNVEILPGHHDRFSFRMEKAGKNGRLRFAVIKHRKYVIVQCAGIS